MVSNRSGSREDPCYAAFTSIATRLGPASITSAAMREDLAVAATICGPRESGTGAGVRRPEAQRLTMCRALIGNALDRTFFSADRRTRQRLDRGAGPFGIRDPFFVEIVRADRFAAHILSRVDLAGVAAVEQLEEMVLGLHVAPGIAD